MLDEVEQPFVAQLVAMGWTHLPGREVGTLDVSQPLLTGRLAAALRRINVLADGQKPGMDDQDIRRSVVELASVSLGKDIATANFDTTDLLLHGSNLTGPPPSTAVLPPPCSTSSGTRTGPRSTTSRSSTSSV